MNGCLFTGIMSLLVAKFSGWLNDRLYTVKEETEDLKEVVIF